MTGDIGHLIIAEVRAGLEGADGLEPTLEVVVAALEGRLPIDRASIRRFDGAMLEVVALWSREPTALGLGARMSALATSLPRMLMAGRPVLRSSLDKERQLVDRIIATEGILSYATLPVRFGGRLVGLLSLSSRAPDAFLELGSAFLEELGAVVERRIAAELAGGDKSGTG